MGTYLINNVRIRDCVSSREALAELQRTVEEYGGRWHSQQEGRALEAARGRSQVLVEFGTMVEAQDWYNSYDYNDVAHRYVDNTIDLVLVDGVSPDFTMAGFAPDRPSSDR